MKTAVRKLWELCFEDGPEFTRFYFGKRYKDEINMAVEEDGEVIAALQMLPYPLAYRGATVQASYVSGACTHPRFRSRGVMKELLKKTHRKMYQQGAALSFLIPAEEWLFGYYAKSGYAPVFAFRERTTEWEEKTALVQPDDICVEVAEKVTPEIAEYLNRKMRERPCCILHPLADLEAVAEGLKLEGVSLYVACSLSAGEIVGLAFCAPEGDTLLVKELLRDSSQVEEALLSAASRKGEIRKIRSIELPAGEGDSLLGMARILNVPRMLKVYARKHPEKKLVFRLTDETIPENRGIYKVKDGKMKHRPFLRGTPYSVEQENLPEMDIAELTRMVFEGEAAYMSLMLN